MYGVFLEETSSQKRIWHAKTIFNSPFQFQLYSTSIYLNGMPKPIYNKISSLNQKYWSFVIIHSLTNPCHSIQYPLVQSKYSILQMKTQLQSKICNNWIKWNSLSNAHADLNELPISNNSIKNSTSICIISDHNSFNHLKPKKGKRHILEGETSYHKGKRKQRDLNSWLATQLHKQSLSESETIHRPRNPTRLASPWTEHSVVGGSENWEEQSRRQWKREGCVVAWQCCFRLLVK